MSAPEQGSSGANPENGPAAGFESTGLWPIDDPEQTTHIQRPATIPPASASPAPGEPSAPASVATPPTATPAPAAAEPAPHVDPEATSVVHRPTDIYTQPWEAAAPSATPPAPAPTGGFAGYPPPHASAGGYHQQYGGYPQGAGHQPAPGYPPGPGGSPGGYSPNPGYPQPQQSGAAEPAPGSFDFTPVTATRSGRRRPVWLIGAGVAVLAIAAVGITGFWKPGFFLTRQLNVSKVQEGVQHILTDQNTGYGISGVTGVVCNDGHNPSGDQGTKFRCSLSVNGAQHSVEVTVVDDHGTYQVGKIT